MSTQLSAAADQVLEIVHSERQTSVFQELIDAVHGVHAFAGIDHRGHPDDSVADVLEVA